jgi:hypothetical protein
MTISKKETLHSFIPTTTTTTPVLPTQRIITTQKEKEETLHSSVFMSTELQMINILPSVLGSSSLQCSSFEDHNNSSSSEEDFDIITNCSRTLRMYIISLQNASSAFNVAIRNCDVVKAVANDSNHHNCDVKSEQEETGDSDTDACSKSIHSGNKKIMKRLNKFLMFLAKQIEDNIKKLYSENEENESNSSNKCTDHNNHMLALILNQTKAIQTLIHSNRFLLNALVVNETQLRGTLLERKVLEQTWILLILVSASLVLMTCTCTWLYCLQWKFSHELVQAHLTIRRLELKCNDDNYHHQQRSRLIIREPDDDNNPSSLVQETRRNRTVITSL